MMPKLCLVDLQTNHEAVCMTNQEAVWEASQLFMEDAPELTRAQRVYFVSRLVRWYIEETLANLEERQEQWPECELEFLEQHLLHATRGSKSAVEPIMSLAYLSLLLQPSQWLWCKHCKCVCESGTECLVLGDEYHHFPAKIDGCPTLVVTDSLRPMPESTWVCRIPDAS